MQHVTRRLCVVLIAAGLLAAAVPGAGAQDGPSILETHVFPEVPLAEPQGAALPDHPIADDRGFLLGGVGSDLWRAPGDPAGEFWMVTDRGPNGEIDIADETRRTFPVPDFAPLILNVRATGGTIEILDAIPLVGRSGAPLTGLSNLPDLDEKPWDYSAQVELDYDPNGLDTEGMIRTAAGEFWLAEEYRPSLVKVAADGTVIARYVPDGVTLDGADYDVVASLPAIYAERKNNRGFEGLALSPDEATLFVTLQSPLSIPDEDTGENSRTTRILAVDAATGQAVAEYAYVFDEATEFDPDPEVERGDMKLSGVVAVDADTLLILERTDAVAKLYTVELAEATNLLGGAFDDPANAMALESIENLLSERVVALPKTLLVDLSTLDGMPQKIEGVAVVDATTVAVANDNDFDIGELDAAGQNVGDGTPSLLLIVRTPPIPGLGADAATPPPAATPVEEEATPVAAAPRR